MQRLSDIHVTQHGGAVTIPIEIVALSLVSVNPITVTYNGGQNPELWNVRVVLPTNQQQQPRTMIVIQTDPKGGTYDSTLPVLPIFTFRRLRDGVKIDSVGTGETIGHIADVSFKADRSYNLLISPHFCPSCDLTGAPVSSSFTSDLIIQIVRPATLP